jgi:hypothetical protein
LLLPEEEDQLMKHLLVLVVFCAGCGASALSMHATAANAVRTLNDEAVVIVEEQCEVKAHAAAEDRTVTVDQAEAQANAVIEACEGIEDAQHAFAAAHGVWVSTLLTFMAEDSFDAGASLRLARDILQLYVELVALAGQLDIELPELPGALSGLVEEG